MTNVHTILPHAPPVSPYVFASCFFLLSSKKQGEEKKARCEKRSGLGFQDRAEILVKREKEVFG